MTRPDDVRDLTAAVHAYFELMYDCDVSRFGQVFAATSQLHGFRNGEMTVWPAHTYKDVLAKRASPKSQNAGRRDEILLMDFASPTQALVKVRVKIAGTQFVDYLTYHKIDGAWLITGKGYHVESVDAPAKS